LMRREAGIRAEKLQLAAAADRKQAGEPAVLPDLSRISGIPELYAAILGNRHRLLVILLGAGDISGLWGQLPELTGLGVRSRQLRPAASLAILADARRSFVYDNDSLNRIVYRHEYPGQPDLLVISEGTALPEESGFSEFRMDGQLLARSDQPGLTVILLDTDTFLPVCCRRIILADGQPVLSGEGTVPEC